MAVGLRFEVLRQKVHFEKLEVLFKNGMNFGNLFKGLRDRSDML